jgi:GTP cyclohydrolase II
MPFIKLLSLQLKIIGILLKRQVQANLASKWGDYVVYAFSEKRNDQQPHLALVHKNINLKEGVAVRVHSECLTGDLFGSIRCDCGDQFIESMKIISENSGIMIYLRQEGRGIGLINKLEAYNLQDNGLDTIEANIHLGFEPDERDFDIAIDILSDLGVEKIFLITNNPDKIAAIDQSKLQLVKRIPIIIPAKTENKAYLKTKQDYMGHLL